MHSYRFTHEGVENPLQNAVRFGQDSDFLFGNVSRRWRRLMAGLGIGNASYR